MLQVKIVPVTAFAQNCSIVWDSESKEAVLIDAGGDAEKLKAEVKALGLTVKELWLTHGHLDHAGAVGALVNEWNVPIFFTATADKRNFSSSRTDGSYSG